MSGGKGELNREIRRLDQGSVAKEDHARMLDNGQVGLAALRGAEEQMCVGESLSIHSLRCLGDSLPVRGQECSGGREHLCRFGDRSAGIAPRISRCVGGLRRQYSLAFESRDAH